MNGNEKNDNRRHAISRLVGTMNDSLINPITAIKRVSENVTYCEDWDNNHKEQINEVAKKDERTEKIEDNWNNILEANRKLIDEIKSRVESEEIDSANKIIEKQKKVNQKIENMSV